LLQRTFEVLACSVEPCHLPQNARACRSTSTCAMPLACVALSVRTAYSIKHLAKHNGSQQFSTFVGYHFFRTCGCSACAHTVGTSIFTHGDPGILRKLEHPYFYTCPATFSVIQSVHTDCVFFVCETMMLAATKFRSASLLG
jgi:hypothetical protein